MDSCPTSRALHQSLKVDNLVRYLTGPAGLHSSTEMSGSLASLREVVNQSLTQMTEKVYLG